MTQLDSVDEVALQRKAKGKRPYYFSNPDVDKLLSMVMALKILMIFSLAMEEAGLIMIKTTWPMNGRP